MGLQIRWQRRGRPSDEIRVFIPGAGSLPAPSHKELEEVVNVYSKEVLNEAGRLEANSRRHKGEPVVTAHHIKYADLQVRQGFTPRTGGRRYNILETIAFSAAIAAGVFGGKLDQPWGPVGLVCVSIIGIIAYATRGSK